MSDDDPRDLLDDDASVPDDASLLDDAGLDDASVDDADLQDDASLPGLHARWELPDPTGVPAVDEALEPLADLDALPTAEHVAYYETAHRRLQDALADLDGS